jgi:uncharacterized protein (DUF433 family)
MTIAVEHAYVTRKADTLGGEPIIKGTRTPVRAIVELYRLGTSPEEIPSQLPHLNLAQIFDALSYYSDHTDEINRFISLNKIDDDLAIAE